MSIFLENVRDRYYNFKINLEDIPSEKTSKLSKKIPLELASSVLEYGVIEEKYWYHGEKNASMYIALNRDSKSNYKVFSQMMATLQKNLPEIIQHSFQHFQDVSNVEIENPLPIDFVSLGAGGMDKEFKVLEAFVSKYRDDHGTDVRINFMFVEESFQVISHALKLIAQQLAEKNIERNVNVKPYLLDFHKASPSYFSKNPRKFITALGIIHNASFPNIFQSLKNVMTPESLLLLDADVIGDRSDKEIKKSYDNDAMKKWWSLPLFTLNECSEKSYKIQNREKQTVGNIQDFKNYAPKDGDITVYVITKDTITSFIKEHNIPQKAIEKIRISKDPGSKTVIMVYEPHDSKTPSVVLGQSTRFQKDELIKTLEEEGFEVVKTFVKSGSNAVYFLLRLGNYP